MDSLQNTVWTTVDRHKSLVIKFGSIDATADPREMHWERFNSKGESVGFGKALRIDDASFHLSSVEGSVGKFVGDFVEGTTIAYVVTSTNLSLTQGAVTFNLEQV